MYHNEFGDFVRLKRTALRLSLRAFADKAAMDPGNASRLERGRIPPPEDMEVLGRIASALNVEEGSTDYEHLMDVAAAAKGKVPPDLLSNAEVAPRLPILFRTLRSTPLSGEQLEKLIESLRGA